MGQVKKYQNTKCLTLFFDSGWAHLKKKGSAFNEVV